VAAVKRSNARQQEAPQPNSLKGAKAASEILECNSSIEPVEKARKVMSCQLSLRPALPVGEAKGNGRLSPAVLLRFVSVP